MKKKLTIILSTVLAVLMIMSVAAGCGKKESKTLTLALRSGAYAEAIKASLSGFEAKYGIKCDVLELGNDELHEKVALDASNKKGAYDLVMVDGSWMSEFSSNNVLANLSKMGYKFDDDIIKATTAICYKDGDIYLAPYYGNVPVLMYNKDIVKAAGYSGDAIDSVETMLKICQSAKDSGKTGFIYRGDNGDNITVDFLSILLSYGGWVVDDNNKPTVNTPAFKEAMNMYLKLAATGAAQSKNELIASIGGANNNGAMAIGWPGWYSADTPNAGLTAITGKAAKNSATAYNANVFGGWCIGIANNSQNKDNTLKLLEYLMDKDVQKATISVGGVPCRYSSLKAADVLADHPQYSVICDALEGCVYRPSMDNWYEFSTTLGTEIGNILNGVKTVDQGLADAQKALEALK